MESTSVREFAERILLTTSLEEKLTHAPASLVIDPPKRGSYHAPDLPGRPNELIPQKHQAKSAFPSAPQIEHEEHRATLLHFFANHELLAVELMALALLKFPDAPDAFRKGVLNTLKEEQNHTRWYIQRMQECGIQFGDHPVTPMIWEHIATMESPLDYVSRLSLTFEQANLDYAKYYAEILSQAGDSKSAKILTKIYHDEIAHVGHGLKWLRRWKQEAQSDWDAWHQRLHLPLSPMRAKGMAPFNETGRRKAGLDDHFIASLKRYHSSRGRSPDLWYFNPDAEYAAETPSWTCPKRLHDLAADLEPAFALAAPTQDDIVLMRRRPSDSHRDYLAQFDLSFPEIAPFEELETIQKERKMRSVRPWAKLSPLLSKETTLTLRELLPAHLNPLPAKISSPTLLTGDYENWVAKDLYGAAGRGIHRFTQETVAQLPRKSFLIEPWVEKLMEFSLLFHRRPEEEGGLRYLGSVRQTTDLQGQWRSSSSLAKPTHGLSPDLARLIGQHLMPTIRQFIQPALEELLSSHAYLGPICLDSFYYQTPEGPKWQPVVEINARWTMGRLAHEFRRKINSQKSFTLTTCSPPEARKWIDDQKAIVLADPDTASRRVPILLEVESFGPPLL